MAQLTTTSKVLVITACAGFLILLGFGCYSCVSECNQRQQYYNQQVYQQPSYPTNPPYQTVVLDNGSSVMMDYLLWKTLMDQGGPSVVNNYYNSHRNDPEFQSDNQQRYQQNQRNYEEKVQDQKSNGFGARPVETNKSNGFGSKPIETQKSKGFGSSWTSPSIYSSPTTTTTRSNGFGSSSNSSSFKSTPSVSTKPSSGFGSRPSTSVSTTRSTGFGKRN